jgi:hypothetical protein
MKGSTRRLYWGLPASLRSPERQFSAHSWRAADRSEQDERRNESLLAPCTETVEVSDYQLDLPGLTLRAVSSRRKPTGKLFRNQTEAAIP